MPAHMRKITKGTQSNHQLWTSDVMSMQTSRQAVAGTCPAKYLNVGSSPSFSSARQHKRIGRLVVPVLQQTATFQIIQLTLLFRANTALIHPGKAGESAPSPRLPNEAHLGRSASRMWCETTYRRGSADTLKAAIARGCWALSLGDPGGVSCCPVPAPVAVSSRQRLRARCSAHLCICRLKSLPPMNGLVMMISSTSSCMCTAAADLNY
jgi:hypothetical protein